jgi:hypothetical protein
VCPRRARWRGTISAERQKPHSENRGSYWVDFCDSVAVIHTGLYRKLSSTAVMALLHGRNKTFTGQRCAMTRKTRGHGTTAASIKPPTNSRIHRWGRPFCAVGALGRGLSCRLQKKRARSYEGSAARSRQEEIARDVRKKGGKVRGGCGGLRLPDAARHGAAMLL